MRCPSCRYAILKPYQFLCWPCKKKAEARERVAQP